MYPIEIPCANRAKASTLAASAPKSISGLLIALITSDADELMEYIELNGVAVRYLYP